MNPIISIIVPCYNQAQYLQEALQSVLDQSFSNWECIVVNDSSPDNTEEIIKEWLIKDYRFKYIKIKNKGVSNARNVGIKKAVGEFILPLDADDKINDKYISIALNEFKKNSELKLVYCQAEKFGLETGKLVLGLYSLKDLAFYNMIFHASIYKKTDWELVGGYDCNMVEGIEDWEFWIALLKGGGEVKQLDYVGFMYRVKTISRTTLLKEIGNSKLLEYISIKHADFYVRYLGSFHEINKKQRKLIKKYNKLTKSKKQVLNLFFKTFFGLKLFKS